MICNWIAVASGEHVRRGRAGGFMQVCHGKAAQLHRVRPGDRVAYYSPTITFGGKDRLQAFTAIGIVVAGEPYCVELGGGFRPFRRDVAWADAEDAPVRPLLDALDVTGGKPNWGYAFRLGLFPISPDDLRRIAVAMTARLDDLLTPPGAAVTGGAGRRA